MTARLRIEVLHEPRVSKLEGHTLHRRVIYNQSEMTSRERSMSVPLQAKFSPVYEKATNDPRFMWSTRKMRLKYLPITPCIRSPMTRMKMIKTPQNRSTNFKQSSQRNDITTIRKPLFKSPGNTKRSLDESLTLDEVSDESYNRGRSSSVSFLEEIITLDETITISDEEQIETPKSLDNITRRINYKDFSNSDTEHKGHSELKNKVKGRMKNRIGSQLRSSIKIVDSASESECSSDLVHEIQPLNCKKVLSPLPR